MTHLDTDLKHCAADLIFVLCKENGKSKHGKHDQFSERAIPLSTFPLKSETTEWHTSIRDHLC